MTFRRGKVHSEVSSKGAISRNKLYGNPLAKLWKNKDFRQRQKIQGKKYLKEYRSKFTDEEWKKFCSNAGKKSRKFEKIVAKKISKNFSKIFEPFRVCDRIAIKNNQIYFIEIKKSTKDKLKPKQKQFKKICDELGYNYIIYYYQDDTVVKW